MSGDDRGNVQAIHRALDLLEALACYRQGARLSDLSRTVRLAPSTTHRLLSTLAARGYVRQDDASSRYLLGPRLLGLVGQVGEQDELRVHARPILEALVEATGETANLAVCDGAEMVYVEQAQTWKLARIFTAVGTRVPLHSTGVGKVFLAFGPTATVEAALAAELPRRTPLTLTSREALLREIDVVRRRGYAVDNEEHEEGVRCVAAPVFGANGRLVAAMSVSAPSSRLTPSMVSAVAPRVVRAAAELSALLGHRAVERAGELAASAESNGASGTA
ncbi:MAG TPA: IclR family transcriptional regulator [Chloroflexota bacterium]